MLKCEPAHAVRRRAARRALLVDRHGAPPSRRALDEDARGHRQARRPAAAPARQGRRMVRPGGRIVFSNCSLDPLEGETAGRRLSWPEHPDFVLDPIAPGEIAGADRIHHARRHAAHHAGRSRSRQARDFRPRRLLRGAAAAACAEADVERIRIFALALRIYSTNVRRDRGTDRGGRFLATGCGQYHASVVAGGAGALARTRRRLRAGPIYRWRYSGRTPERVLIAPPDLRLADPQIALEIYYGRFPLSGHLVETGGKSPFQLEIANPAMAEIAARLPLAAPHARRRHRARRRQCARAGVRLDRDAWPAHFRRRLGARPHGASASSPGCSIPRSCCRAPSSRSTAPS